MYVRLRSAFDRRWLLGFRGGRNGLGVSPDGHALALPHHMAKARPVHEDACDFLFATAEYSPSDWRLQWTGLLDRVTGAHPQPQQQNSYNVRKYSTP